MSNIDLTVPTYGAATTQSVRDNFAITKMEIEALQDRGAEGRIISALDYGVVPGAPDNTTALQAFFSALQAAGAGYKGVLPGGWLYFTAPLVFANTQHWSFEGAGISATWLVYKGANTTVDILAVNNCSNFSIGGLHIDSLTTMTAGTGLHLNNCGHGYLDNIMVGGQSGATHTGGDGNLHYNLWNGFWFDKIDCITLSNFEAASQNDGARVNGGAGGSGGQADLSMQFGKIMGAVIGMHVGGAFGGLLFDNVNVIGNWHNFVIDQSLAAEFNREIFLGPHSIFDSSGATSSPTVPGPAAQTGNGDNMLINDPNGGFLTIKGWASAAGQGGANIRITAWSGTINIDGCLIPYASGDGIRIDSAVPTVIVTPGTQIHGSVGYGINQTVAMNPVIGAPRFNTNTLGNLSPTTKLGMDGMAVVNGTPLGLLDASGSLVQFKLGGDNHFIFWSTDATGSPLAVWDFYARTSTPTQRWLIPTTFAADVTVGSNTAAQTIALNGPVATNRLLHFQTAGVARWDLYADVNAESGGNFGSNLSIARYADAGGYLDTPFMIWRPTGAVVMANGAQFVNQGGPTIRAGAGAATGTQPKGSIWMRTDGAAGSTLYVTQGGGTWAAIAGV